MKLSEFNKQYKLENPLYNMIERTGAPMFVVFVFFLTGIPVSIILNEKTGTTVAFIFAIIAAIVARYENKKYNKASDKFIEENEDAWT